MAEKASTAVTITFTNSIHPLWFSEILRPGHLAGWPVPPSFSVQGNIGFGGSNTGQFKIAF
jgi:hypothetical protein